MTSTERLYSTATKPSTLPAVFPSRAATHESEVPPGRKEFDLMPLEREVIALVAAGYTTKESAQRLGLSEFALKRQLANILDKLRLANRFELILFALYHQLVGKVWISPP